MTVIVTGGREYTDRDKVFTELKKLNPALIIEGGAKGADRLARRYAIASKTPWKTYDADWTTYGKLAGGIRNGQMLKDWPDAVVLAFPGNIGTANCVRQAKTRKMTVIKVD